MPAPNEDRLHLALLLGEDGTIAGWSEACTSVFGFDEHAALGQPLRRLLAGDSDPSRASSTPDPAASPPGQPVPCDVLLRRADGSTLPASLRLFPVVGGNGLRIASFTADLAASEATMMGDMPLRSVIDVLPGTFYVVRPDGSFALWNKTLEQVAGLSAAQMAHANALDMYDPADQRVIAERIREVFNDDHLVVVEANVRNAHGGSTPFLLCGAKIACHGRAYLCGMGLDISERRAQEDRLRLRERALHATSNGMVITRCCGKDNPVVYVNPAFERITGYSADEVLGRDCRLLAVPGLDDEQRSLVRRAITERRELHVTFRNRRKNGDVFWNSLAITPVSDGRDQVTHYIGVIHDVTAIKQHTAHLEHEVNHDALTGLANRTLLWDRLEQAIHLAHRNKTLVATVLVDLNGFKKINDTYGHEAGDEVLTVVARRLQAAVRESDTVARLAGDEFVLVLSNQPSLHFAMRMVERISTAITKPAMINGVHIPVGASLGVSVYPHDGSSALELVRSADAAMYHAKASKDVSAHFFSVDMKTTSQARQRMEDAMRQALERQELFLLYQPKVSVRDGSIRGLEAFLRWRHPERGVILPASFLPEAEENGMIVDFGNYVLQEACAMIKRMEQAGREPVTVSVNVSYQEFSRRHYTESLAALLARCGLEPRQIELELREEGLNNNHYLGLEVLSQLRDLGVQRSVDAFGDGMCNLHFLQKLPVTRLKLARSAVHQISADVRSGAVCKALIDIGHDLGVQVIAKGVETRLQVDFLKNNHCDELQGQFFSEPLEEASLDQLLASHGA